MTLLFQKIANHLLLLFLLTLITTLLRGLSLLPSDTTRPSTTQWRVEGEVNVLLGVQSNNKGWDVDDPLADTDVALADEDTSVVDRLGETELVDLGLETALQEVLNAEGKHVIEFHAGVVQDTNTDKTTNQSITLEETLGVPGGRGGRLMYVH